MVNIIKNTSKKRALTISEASEYACVSKATVRNWIQSGLMPYEVLPGRGDGTRKYRLIRLADLNEFLNKHYHKPNKTDCKKMDDEIVLLPKESVLN